MLEITEIIQAGIFCMWTGCTALRFMAAGSLACREAHTNFDDESACLTAE
jgi:hypothetical protein